MDDAGGRAMVAVRAFYPSINQTLRMPGPVIAYLALGSNQGDRRRHLSCAVRGLREAGLTVSGVSPVYRTEAHTLDPEETQPDYLNAVVEVRTDRSPEALLDLAKSLEMAAGRDLQAPRWSPRPLDVDLLTVGQQQRAGDDLTLPHPRLAERRFVLQPWADLAPNLVVPMPFEDTVMHLLRRCTDDAALAPAGVLPPP
jgi:2-amino-4-hydroxy-6-hydroxymethyldihydropteridine diphosphokinase